MLSRSAYTGSQTVSACVCESGGQARCFWAGSPAGSFRRCQSPAGGGETFKVITEAGAVAYALQGPALTAALGASRILLRGSARLALISVHMCDSAELPIEVLCCCHVRTQMMISENYALLQGESRGVASTNAIRQAKSQQQGGTVPVIAVVPPAGAGLQRRKLPRWRRLTQTALQCPSTVWGRQPPASAGGPTARLRTR